MHICTHARAHAPDSTRYVYIDRREIDRDLSHRGLFHHRRQFAVKNFLNATNASYYLSKNFQMRRSLATTMLRNAPLVKTHNFFFSSQRFSSIAHAHVKNNTFLARTRIEPVSRDKM